MASNGKIENMTDSEKVQMVRDLSYAVYRAFRVGSGMLRGSEQVAAKAERKALTRVLTAGRRAAEILLPMPARHAGARARRLLLIALQQAGLSVGALERRALRRARLGGGHHGEREQGRQEQHHRLRSRSAG